MVVAIACPVMTVTGGSIPPPTSDMGLLVRSSPGTRFSGSECSDKMTTSSGSTMSRSASVSPTLSTSTEESETTLTGEDLNEASDHSSSDHGELVQEDNSDHQAANMANNDRRLKDGPRHHQKYVASSPGMEHGLMILHQHQSSHDSSDSGSLPPSYSRLPPDGHEFPEDYVDPSLNGQGEPEYLSRKSSASSTASLDRHDLKTGMQGDQNKVSGVRAKIAMFSNSPSKSRVDMGSKPGLGKFQSSEDVGKVSGVPESLTRAHTHGDVRFDTDGTKKSQKSLNAVNGTSEIRDSAKGSKVVSNLKPGHKGTSFRSMINVSSSVGQERSSTLPSPEESTDKAISVRDLTKSTDNLIRRNENNKECIIWEEDKPASDSKPRATPPSITNRSQSLNEIGKSQKMSKRHTDIGTQGRSRSSNVIVTPTEQPNAGSRKSSMTTLIEQRRRSTMNKLKGLVIPEVREGVENSNGNPQLNSKNNKNVLNLNNKASSVISNKNLSGGSLPSPPWKEKDNEFPKYSPAFKRKPFTVYSTKHPNSRLSTRDGQSENQEPATFSPGYQRDKSEILDNSTPGKQEQLAYKPPIGKRNSDEGILSSPNGLKTEDSDNDSAVSSGRSSLSGRSNSPTHSPKTREKNNRNSGQTKIDTNPRVLKKNSVEAINRQNVINACKKSSSSVAPISEINDLKKTEKTEPPLETSSPRNSRTCGRPASRSSSFTIAERKKSFESQQSESASSRRSSNSSQDSGSRRGSKDTFESGVTTPCSRRSSREVVDELGSRRSSRVTTPTGNCANFPDSILDIEEKVAYMSDVVDRAASVTPTEKRSVSRTNSIASERSTYSSRSSRNSSIVSEKAPFARNNSILSKDSAISEDIGRESISIDLPLENGNKWSELEKKYSKGLGAKSIGDKISKLTKPEDVKTERPKDLAIMQKKLSNGVPSPKNFKELAEKWQTISVDTPSTLTSPVTPTPTVSSATLPRKSSKEKKLSPNSPLTSPDMTPATLPRKHSNSRQKGSVQEKKDSSDEGPWSPPASSKSAYYQVNGGEAEWSGFEMTGKCDLPDRKFSVPAYNESCVKLRDKRDNMPSRPASLIESSEQKDLKIFEIGNLGDNHRLLYNSNSTSQSSSQADLLDSNSVTSDTPKSPLPSSSSREILEVFSNRNNRRAVSVNDIRRAFEKAEQSLSNSGTPKRLVLSSPSSHNRMSSLDSTTSEESSIPTPHFHGSVSSLTSGHGGGLRDHYGSISSLASSTSMISPQELQNLIDEANHSLEESGTPSHEIMVIVLHREFSGGSIGITLAGGADYESKEITVHKVIAGSLADRDGRIQKGDRVLSINGRSTKGVTHREALSILKAPRAEVVLVLSRSRSVTPADRGNYDMVEAGYNYINSSRPPKILESPLDSKSLMADLKFVDVPRGPPTTVTLKKEGTGLGFSLEGGKDSPYGDRPMTIKKIFTGGAADKNGVLRVGDEILSVNTVDVTRMTRLEAWNFMKKLNDGSQVVVVRQKLDPTAKQGLVLHTGPTVPIVKTELVEDAVPEEKTH